ncbi:MAG: diheme cytochrome c-553 [Saprospiraceae bacterium]|uniref:Diheme cytochrome c-553 n=1 Tax=Candidatus Opimibacter skivensis TaxID=2982028 RepID=A0A9D7XS23_9BACT|nr:diheme cytochrome c-553 [Candidatus Opimibacter skivensis]
MKKPTSFRLPLLCGHFFPACQADNKTGPTATDQAAVKPAAPAGMTKADSIKRGEYLVNTIGCSDCHSPKMMTDHGPIPDPALLLSGHPASEVLPKMPDKKFIAPGQWILLSKNFTSFTGPWGTSFAANLTPHESGLGNWTFENFERAIRTGKHPGAGKRTPYFTSNAMA